MSKKKKSNEIEKAIDDPLEKRRKNLQKNVELLKSLGLYTETSNTKPTVSRNNSNNMKTKLGSIPSVPKRRSVRLENKDKQTTFEFEYKDIEVSTIKKGEKIQKPVLKGNVDLKDISKLDYSSLKNISTFLKCIPLPEGQENTDLLRYTDSAQKMNLYKYFKNSTGSVQSMAFHPSNTKLMLSIGDSFGNICLSDLNNESSPSFKPHSDCVYSLTFARNNPSHLYSTSVDGSTRRTDLIKLMSDDIYFSDETHTTWHAEIDEHTLLISHGSGDVAVIDLRRPTKPQAYYRCHKKSARTIDINSKNRNNFVTSSKTKEVRIWDLRNMKSQKKLNDGEPLESVQALFYSSSVTSAFYSPDGDSLLTTCYDNRVRVYHELETNPKVVLEYNHTMLRTPYHATYKAKWHPQRNDTFFIGTHDKQRSINILSVHGNVTKTLTDPELKTILSTCSHHPNMNMIAGGDNQGRFYVFGC